MAPEKFKKLVHYVIARCEDPTRLGATRLNKILWFSDSIAYRLNGVSISGEAYVKRQHGPVPRHILVTLQELKGEGQILIRDREHFGRRMKMFVSLNDPEIEFLSEQERQIAEDVMDAICEHHTAQSISDLSHDIIWEAAHMGEEIPMAATLAANVGEISPEIMAWADNVVESRRFVNIT